jgi:hypothetical protein
LQAVQHSHHKLDTCTEIHIVAGPGSCHNHWALAWFPRGQSVFVPACDSAQ